MPQLVRASRDSTSPPRMTQRILLLSILLAVALLGGGLWLALQTDPSASGRGQEEELLPERVEPIEEVHLSAPLARAPVLDEEEVLEAVRTTVVIPLEVDLELVEATGRLAAEGFPALGSAATARLRGSAHHADGQGVAGRVEFIAGPNRGRELELDSRGSFGANDLYPGLSLVSITGAGVPGVEREVLLRADRESDLNVGFGRPAIVFGQVRDEGNDPLQDANVRMDGQEARTDELGMFRFVRMTSGKVPIYVSKPGYASVREMVFITAGSTIAPGRLKYVLRPAAKVSVAIAERLGTGAAGSLFLTGSLEPRPLSGGASRTYPWHLVSPTTIFPGETIEVEDLPAGRARLQLFVPGAIVEPRTQLVNLVAGERKHVTFHLSAAPILTGRVTLEGRPVDRALVRLEAPDVTEGTIAALGAGHGRATIELELLDQVPPAVQQVYTGADGGFRFSAAEEVAPTRYLTARSPDGRSWAGRVVTPGELEVDLALKPAEGGKGGFRIETSERHQALPVEYVVNGAPHAVTLPAGEPLRIEGIPEGTWRVTVRWGTETILLGTPIEITGVRELFVPLPQGAIDGQPDALRKAMEH